MALQGEGGCSDGPSRLQALAGILCGRRKREHGITRDVGRREILWEGGVALVVLGTLGLMLSVLWVVVCAAGSIGPCLGVPFQGRQGFLELVGVILLVTGLGLLVIGKRPTLALANSAAAS